MIIECQWDMCKYTREIPETDNPYDYRKAILDAGWTLRLENLELIVTIDSTSVESYPDTLRDKQFAPEDDLVYCSEECYRAHMLYENLIFLPPGSEQEK